MAHGQQVGRYRLYEPIAAGGMATVHLGQTTGAFGFARLVAIKRLHPHLALDVDFTEMFLDEARIAARIHHPNVVTTLDVVGQDRDLFIVMEYVPGASLAQLLSAAREAERAVPPAIVSAIVRDALRGLQAAHEVRDERGVPLELVHRDVSPQNILIGLDGVSRVADFGVAKAANRAHATSDGRMKGKLAYMSPEQLQRQPVDHRADLYAMGVVLWEALTLQGLFRADDALGVVTLILAGNQVAPSALLPEETRFDALVSRALSLRPEERFGSAGEMLAALESAVPPASASTVGEWVRNLQEAQLAERAARIARIESHATEQAPNAVRIADMPTVITGSLLTAPNPKEPGADSAPDERPIRLDMVTDAPAPAHDGASAPALPGRGRRARIALLGASLLVAAGVGAFGVRSETVRLESDDSRTPITLARSPRPASKPGNVTGEAGPTAVSTRPADPARRAPTKASGAPRPNLDAARCSPPYTVDGRGIRRFKPECIE